MATREQDKSHTVKHKEPGDPTITYNSSSGDYSATAGDGSYKNQRLTDNQRKGGSPGYLSGKATNDYLARQNRNRTVR
jgi:hypothetical protein